MIIVTNKERTNYANIHGWPKLHSGNQFEICDSKSGWYYILIAGKYYGWISGDYVAVDSQKQTNTATTTVQPAPYRDNSIAGRYRVTADYLNLRTGAGKDYAIIDVLPNGTFAMCYGFYDVVGNIKWYRVVANGKTGFVSSHYLKKY